MRNIFPLLFLSHIFKLSRVDVGNVSKKGKNMKGIVTWGIL